MNTIMAFTDDCANPPVSLPSSDGEQKKTKRLYTCDAKKRDGGGEMTMNLSFRHLLVFKQ